MARIKGGKNKADSTNGTPMSKALGRDNANQLPDGFEEVFGARVKGWFAREAGNTLTGRLLEVFQTKSRFSADGKKNVYKVEVTRGQCDILTVGEGDEEGRDVARVGDVVGLDESGWLKRLSSVELGREVYVRCLGKDDPTEEYPQGAWRYTVGVNKADRVNLKTGEVNNTPARG